MIAEVIHPNIEMLRPSALKPNPRNARTHSAKQITQIGASIRRFGFAVPIVIDGDNMIAAGHGRWLAAKQLDLKEVPVIRLAFVTDEDRRAFALAENRIAELSGWDDKLLTEELTILFEGGYELEITGFTTADLDLSVPAMAKSEKPERVDLPDPSVEAVTRTGDLWLIGPHRLYAGSSLDASSYETLLGGDRAAMVFSDPPYNVPIDGHVSGLGRVRHREFAQASGEMSQGEFTMFLRTVFRHCVTFSARASIHYQCMDWRHTREIIDAADGVYDEHKQLLVWMKDNAGMGAFYRSQHELIFVFKAGRGKHINNFGLGETGRYRTNILKYAGANTFRKGRKEDLEAHATVKPTALVADLILDCSNKGDLILDPFSGSGTTLLSAHVTGRRGAAIEIDPLYVDTAIARLTKVSGLEARHADGRSFDEVATQRAAEQEVGRG